MQNAMFSPTPKSGNKHSGIKTMKSHRVEINSTQKNIRSPDL